MFPVDLRALRAPHGLARRVQPALSAVRPSVLSVTQRPNTSPRHKIDRAFAAKKPSSQHAHTLERASRFPSASCALLPRSFARVQLPTPFFSCAPTLFSKNTGGAVSRRKSCLHSMSCALCKTRMTEKSQKDIQINCATAPQPSSQPRMRQPHLCVIVSGRPPVSAWRVSRIIKTQSEVHSL